jgi:hypothetical protein
MGKQLHEFLRRLEDQLEMTSDESNEQSPLKDPESGFITHHPAFISELSIDPRSFVDSHFIKELKDNGYIGRLYGDKRQRRKAWHLAT